MECPECGTPASEEDLFCGECGAVLEYSRPREPSEDPKALDLSAEEPLPPALPAGSPPSAPAIRDSRARAAFILGLVSLGSIAALCLPLSVLAGCIGPVAGIVAIVLGALVRRDFKARGGLEQDRKMALWGMILGIVGIAIYVVMLALGLLAGIAASLLGEL